jgi:gp16 family phage-associated protein
VFDFAAYAAIIQISDEYSIVLAKGSESVEIAKDPAVFTVEQVRLRFNGSGVSMTDWARQHGFSRQIVYSLLSGRTRGNRGTAHAAAVALGLKREMDISELNLAGRSDERSKESTQANSLPQERTMTS